MVLVLSARLPTIPKGGEAIFIGRAEDEVGDGGKAKGGAVKAFVGTVEEIL